MRSPRQQRLGFAEPDRRALANRATHLIDVLVVQDCEQPCPQIGAVLPQMKLTEGRPRPTLPQITARGELRPQSRPVPPRPGGTTTNPLIVLPTQTAPRC